MNKAVSSVGVLTGAAAAISKDDFIFIISVVIVILNLLIEYMRSKDATRKTPED